MKPHDARILERIAEEICLLGDMLDGVSRERFNADEVLKRACAMSSINIGELAKHLSDGFHAEFPGNELKMAAKTRDVYAHGYYTLSFDRVYTTAVEDYPRVLLWVESVLAEAGRPCHSSEIKATVREAHDIITGEVDAVSYRTAADMFAALDGED